MKTSNTTAFLIRASVCACAFSALRLSADVVETTNGARIVGKIKLIHGGVITLATDYAGDLSIKQSLVTSITTDRPVAVRTAAGTRVIGIVSPAPAGGVQVVGPKGSVSSPVSGIACSWAAGEEDPDVVASRRKWSYEANADLTGEKGTHSQLGTSYGFRAALIGPVDALKYYTSYSRQETDGSVSENQFKAGADYEATFAPPVSWYVRDELGFDPINSISFYDIAAGGLGHDFIKEKDQTFTGRVGLSYRYDRYSDGGMATLSEAGADFGLAYSRKFKTSLLTDTVTFDPTFQDLGNFVLTHELRFDIPLANPFWKLSMGVTNNYNSRPVPGVEKLETLYFTRLVLTWGVK